MPRTLLDGVYEHPITEELEAALAAVDPLRQRAIRALPEGDLALVIARHLGRETERVLSGVPHKERPEVARRLLSVLLEQLAALVAPHGVDPAIVTAQRLAGESRQLLAIHRGVEPERPATPLAISTLLTRHAKVPTLGHELAREIGSAHRIDAVLAFVTVGGVRSVRDSLEAFARNGVGDGRLRILTTTFTGTTEIEALDILAALPGASVKVSYDIRRTRLHAKAWLFHRETGLSTAYIGSANFTATALGSGQEWMVKVCQADLPHVVEQVEGTFETLWNDPEFEVYRPSDEQARMRLRAALAATVETAPADALSLITLRPYAFQDEILDRLEAERRVHGRRRNLVVAATGTGKTVMAAFDYSRIAAAVGTRPRLLFLAHRREILVQARDTFRHVLSDAAFGELLTGEDAPEGYEYLFATIQSVGPGQLIDRFGPEYWRHVVVDECHHVPATSYQQVVPRLSPDILVGLTATPERTDGKSLLPDFDNHVAAELRLWRALERQLLVPFEYFGLSDGVDLRNVRWSRAGYDLSQLGEVYSGNEARADLVRVQLGRRVREPRSVRALGFCVSVQHAEFMATRFSAAGLPALAVHGGSLREVREDAKRRLQRREVSVLFTCDLYNEGVDLPYVDTLLLLRPTTSATLFMQQLGRGLRLHPDKSSCLVLDFIGQHREEFRFDNVLSALAGVPRAKLREAVEQGFPYLPSGCALQLDSVARDTILRSLRTSLAGAQRLGQELREISAGRPAPLSLRQFLEESGRDLEDVYGPRHGWAMIRKLAGVPSRSENEAETEDLSRRLGWLTHVDEPDRLRAYGRMLSAAARGERIQPDARDRIRAHMLEFQLSHRGVLRVAEESVQYLADRPAIVAEFEELREVLEDRVGLAEEAYPVPEWPLALHRHYGRREITAAVGYSVPGKKGNTPQGGILGLPGLRELLFVTLDKSGGAFSPSTRYRDFAVSRDVFHWETQGACSVMSVSGRRYIESPANGWTFYLFVRSTPEDAYAFLGPVTHVGHTGDRPIAITWRLERPMPGALFEAYASLASG